MIYGTPEYIAWVDQTDAKIRGRNMLTRAEKFFDDGSDVPLVNLPSGLCENSEFGFRDHARLYGVQIR